MSWTGGPQTVSVTACLLLLSSCSGPPHERDTVGDPFSFSEVRNRATLIQRVASENNDRSIEQLRSAAPRVATLYGEALARFDSIYGEGVGPAKHTPEYQNCKQSFSGVAVRIRAPLAPNDTGLLPLWIGLKECRISAVRWGGPAEMATFGRDLESMANGAMLVLSYAATVNGSATGPEMYREIEPPAGEKY